MKSRNIKDLKLWILTTYIEMKQQVKISKYKISRGGINQNTAQSIL